MKKRNLFKYIIFAFIVFALVDVEVNAEDFLSYDNFVTCGNITNIPRKVPELISTLINVTQVIVPVLLVIFGVIDLVKGIMAQKEDEIKKGQQTLIKRIIIGAVVFLVIMLVKLLVNFVADNNRGAIIECVNCFVSGECSESADNAETSTDNEK